MPRAQKQFHFIYKTTNVMNGKFYIGMHSTNNMNDGYIGSGKRLRYSIKKYGKDNHTVEIIEIIESRDKLKDREREIVNALLLENPLCLNLVTGGEGGRYGLSCSDEMKKKLSDSNKGKHSSPSTEARAKMSLSTKGVNLSKEHKMKIGDAHRGKIVSEETKKKLSAAGKGKSLSNEHKMKISESGKGTLKPGNCKIVIVDEIEYRSLRDAASALGLKHHIVLKRMIDSKDAKHNKIYYKDQPKEQYGN